MLSDRKIKSLKPIDKAQWLADHNGLYLRIGPESEGGGKTFRFRYKKTSKSLGKYLLETTLEEARETVRGYKKDIAKGIDPFKKKQKELEAASDFIEAYSILKGLDEDSKAYKDVVRNMGYLTSNLGDHPPHEYSKVEINSFIRDRCKSVRTTSVRREFNSICAVFNLVFEEHEIDHFHRFRKLRIPKEGLDSEERDDFMRPLKTRSSQRIIPLVGSSLAAAHCLDLSEEWIFPKYLKTKRGKESANAAINKRLHKILGPGSPTSHSFRHTLTTRLRSVECPEDMRNELGGWASSVSAMYGTPTDITNKAGYIEKALDWSTEIYGYDQCTNI